MTPPSVARARRILDEAIERFNPLHVFGLFSGGHDSLCACHIASQHPRFDGCIHINTGIGIEETRVFVRQTCKGFGWPLKEYHPPQSYESMVIEYGFPGPAMHWKMYHRLKERCLRQLLKDHGTKKDKIVFVSGVRRQESQRRMLSCDARDPIQEGPEPSRRAIWTNIIVDWSGGDKNEYIRKNNLPKNPVVELLCMSGECLCGAFAQPNELEEIRMFYPAAAEEIDRIADLVEAAGKHCVWGTRPPRSSSRSDKNQMELPLCFSCSAKHERNQPTIQR